MLSSASDGVYRSSLLSEVSGIEHGFGSRSAPGWPGEYSRLKQTHSAIVHVAPGSPEREGDALITSVPGVWIGVRTADCVPILLSDTHQGVVAAIHAGWRGTIDGIVTETVKKMTMEFGSLPQNIQAAIGPCIAVCCFEVGEEVRERYRTLFPEVSDLRNIDLVEANRRQLRKAGVQSIDIDNLCTYCLPDQFDSYRRDRDRSGRMVSAIRILSPN